MSVPMQGSQEMVLRKGMDFVDVMTQITDRSEFSFTTYSTRPPLEEIATRCQGMPSGASDEAVASLTIVPADINSFELRGTHALIRVQDSRWRSGRVVILCVAICIVVFTLLAFVWRR